MWWLGHGGPFGPPPNAAQTLGQLLELLCRQLSSFSPLYCGGTNFSLAGPSPQPPHGAAFFSPPHVAGFGMPAHDGHGFVPPLGCMPTPHFVQTPIGSGLLGSLPFWYSPAANQAVPHSGTAYPAAHVAPCWNPTGAAALPLQAPHLAAGPGMLAPPVAQAPIGFPLPGSQPMWLSPAANQAAPSVGPASPAANATATELAPVSSEAAATSGAPAEGAVAPTTAPTPKNPDNEGGDGKRVGNGKRERRRGRGSPKTQDPDKKERRKGRGSRKTQDPRSVAAEYRATHSLRPKKFAPPGEHVNHFLALATMQQRKIADLESLPRAPARRLDEIRSKFKRSLASLRDSIDALTESLESEMAEPQSATSAKDKNAAAATTPAAEQGRTAKDKDAAATPAAATTSAAERGEAVRNKNAAATAAAGTAPATQQGGAKRAEGAATPAAATASAAEPAQARPVLAFHNRFDALASESEEGEDEEDEDYGSDDVENVDVYSEGSAAGNAFTPPTMAQANIYALVNKICRTHMGKKWQPYNGEDYEGTARRLCSQNWLELHPIKGDGNCGFAAVATSIDGSRDGPAALRRQVAEAILAKARGPDAVPAMLVEHARVHLASHGRESLKDVSEDADDRAVVAAYAQFMGTSGSYATTLELSILATLTSRPIYVLEVYGSTSLSLGNCRDIPPGPILPNEDFGPSGPLSPHPIFLLYKRDPAHFHALLPQLTTALGVLPPAEAEEVADGASY